MTAVRDSYADFVRSFANVLFAVSLFAVWGLLTLIGVIVDQGKDPSFYLADYSAADRARHPAPALRQHLPLAGVHRDHRA